MAPSTSCGWAWWCTAPWPKGLLTGTYAKGATFGAGDYRAFMVNDASIARTAELVDYLRALPEPMQARGDGHSS